MGIPLISQRSSFNFFTPIIFYTLDFSNVNGVFKKAFETKSGYEMHYNFKLFVIHSDTNLTCINTDRIINECRKKKMTDLQCKSTFDIKYSV